MREGHVITEAYSLGHSYCSYCLTATYYLRATLCTYLLTYLWTSILWRPPSRASSPGEHFALYRRAASVRLDRRTTAALEDARSSTRPGPFPTPERATWRPNAAAAACEQHQES